MDPSIDLGPSAAEQEALASVMQRVEERSETARQVTEAQRPSKPFLARPSTMIGSSVVLVGVLIFNAVSLKQEPVALTSQQAADVAHAHAALTVLGVEAFRAEQGRLPGSLDELQFGFDGLQYHPNGTRYSLTAEVDGQAAHLAEYDDPNRLLVPGGGRP